MEEQREDRGELAWILDRRRLNEFGFPWVFGFASCRWDHLPDQNLVEKKGKYRYEGAKQGSLVVWRKKNKTETGQIYLQFWLSWASKKKIATIYNGTIAYTTYRNPYRNTRC